MTPHASGEETANTNATVQVAATDLAARLKRLGLLESRLDWLGIRAPESLRNVIALLDGRAHGLPRQIGKHELEAIEAWGLVRVHDGAGPPARPVPPLPFVFAVNIELTYDCNYRCSHCLQNGLRKQRSGQWIDTGTAKRAVEQAWFAGLLRAGLNLTGGEPVHASSNLAALLEVARLHGVPVRVNTNGWWGQAKEARVGNRKFTSPLEVVRWLRDSGTHVLALSVDSRYARDGVPWQPVANIIRICESESLPYEIVGTGGMTRQEIEYMRGIAGVRDGVLPFTRLEPVDIGCTWSASDGAVAARSFEPGPPPCMWKGFYAPAFLHIEPGGGVRTCMYAPGSGALGNLHQQDLLSIVNRFNRHPITRLFRGGKLSRFIAKHVDPYASCYRTVVHPCAFAAVVSRVAEGVLKARVTAAEPATGPLTSERLRGIHERIATEYRLST